MKFLNVNINEIGLSFLSWVKKLKGQKVNTKTFKIEDQELVNHRPWTALLKNHVQPWKIEPSEPSEGSTLRTLGGSKNGHVNYQGFIKDKDRFQQYLNTLSKTGPGKNWTETQELAYWINAYNAFTVKLIIDHYPLKSIKDISSGLPMINSPWDIKFFKIRNVEFDLNTIEHEILRKQFNEPRIHFAINCASFSCPILRNEAYDADKLEAQLDEQALRFIQNPDKNIINEKQILLSPIFSWFEKDFTINQSLKTYLKKYHPSVDEQLPIRFMDYDWSLNEE
jgi:hypothetical protein